MKLKLNVCLLLLVMFALAGCSGGEEEATVGGTGGGQVAQTENEDATPPPEEESEPTPEKKETKPKSSNKFDHYNPQAWHGEGSALVLCSGSHMSSCSIEGKQMSMHGSLDRGREVWTLYHRSGLGGTIICENGSKSFAYEVSGRGVQYGSCN